MSLRNPTSPKSLFLDRSPISPIPLGMDMDIFEPGPGLVQQIGNSMKGKPSIIRLKPRPLTFELTFELVPILQSRVWRVAGSETNLNLRHIFLTLDEADFLAVNRRCNQWRVLLWCPQLAGAACASEKQVQKNLAVLHNIDSHETKTEKRRISIPYRRRKDCN